MCRQELAGTDVQFIRGNELKARSSEQGVCRQESAQADSGLLQGTERTGSLISTAPHTPLSTLHTYPCTQVASLTMLLQLERDEAANWRVKWAEEATKTDGVKRECMQVLYSYYDRSACRVWAS